MANGQIFTTAGNKMVFNRAFKETPDYAAPTVFMMGTGTTTPAASQTALVTPVDLDGDNIKEFVSGYPTFDETNLQVTYRCFLNSLEANGNSLSEFGIFNEDASPIMISRTVFTPITKTAAVEISIIEKEKMI